MAFLVISSVLVLLMIPGVGFFYSGLARRKSALQLILLSMISVSVVGFQWFFWGYSLVFSRGTAGKGLIGDLAHFGLMKTLGQPSGSGDAPDILFCLYQGMFAAITYVLDTPLDSWYTSQLLAHMSIIRVCESVCEYIAQSH